jgi:hypothetical protein
MRFLEGLPGLIRKLIGLAVLVAIVGFIAFGVINYLSKPQPPPDANQAPWEIQTSSRIYLGKEMQMVGADPALKGYWTLEGNRYQYHDNIIKFTHTLYGNVKIIRRK